MTQNPYLIVDELERRIADWCGAKYGVAVESGTSAIFLSIQWRKEQQRTVYQVTIPKNTYPSVPCSIIHAGGKVVFSNNPWEGEYELYPYRIWDSALRLKPGMFKGKELMEGLQCLSFHIKKKLNVGRGGIVLTDSKEAYEWLKRARFDGRSPVPLQEDNFTQLGWNMYMQPADAARAIQLFEIYKDRGEFEDLSVEAQGYPDLSKYPVYQQ